MLPNPFQPHGPILDKHGFLNQKELIRKVLQRLQVSGSCILVGGAQMGKTSILHRIEQILSDSSELEQYVEGDRNIYLPVYFLPSRESISLRNVFQELETQIFEAVERLASNASQSAELAARLRSIGLTTRMGGAPRIEWCTDDHSPVDIRRAFAHDMLQFAMAAQAKIRNLRIILLIDNLDYIQDHETRDMFIQCLLELLDPNPYNHEFEFLHQYFAFVFACHRDLTDEYPRLQERLPPGLLPNVTHRFPILALHKSAILDAYSGHLSGVRSAVSEDLIQSVALQVGGHPFFYQLYGHQLWEHVASSTAGDGWQLDEASIDDACIEFIDRIRRILPVDTLEFRILTVLNGDYLRDWRLEEIGRSVAPISGSDLRKAVRTLCHFGLIHEVTTSTYQFGPRILVKMLSVQALHGKELLLKHPKILFLSANPANEVRLRTAHEYKEIRKSIIESGAQKRISLASEWAVRIDELIQLLVSQKPTIVHFSGHGSEQGEIILEDEFGDGVPISRETVRRIFGILSQSSNQIRCVLLNACFSEQQAVHISESVDIVVGISSEIADTTAVRFASTFYGVIGEGESVKTAFDLACEDIGLDRLPTQQSLRLIVRDGIDPSVLRFVG